MSTAFDELLRTESSAHGKPRSSERPRLDFRTVQVNSIAPFASYSLTSSSPVGMPSLGQTQVDPQVEVLEQMTSARRLSLADLSVAEEWADSFREVSEEARRLLQATMLQFAPTPTGRLSRVSSKVAPASVGSDVRPLALERLDFSSEAVALLKSVGSLDDSKSLAGDLHRTVTAAKSVEVRVVTDPEFGDATLNFVIHTSGSVEDVLASEGAVNDRLFSSYTYQVVPEVAVTYEFEVR